MQRNALSPTGRLRQTDRTEPPRLTQDGQLWLERLAAIVSLSADAIVALDRERRIVLYNEGAEKIFGWRRDEVVGKPGDVLVPPRLRDANRRLLDTFAAGPAASWTTWQEQEICGLRKSGEEFPAEARLTKIDVGGAVLLTATVREVRQRFLAELAEVLITTTPDHESVLAQLATLAARDLGDWVVIDLLDADQRRRFKVVCSDPANRALAEELESFPIDRERPYLMFEPLTARRPVLIPEVTADDVESLAHSPEHLRVLRALEIRSLIVVPLLARGRPLGAIALLSSRRSRRYGEPHLRLAQELARIAALTIGNALLYGSAQRAITMRDEVMAIVAHDLRGWLGVILMQCELGGCRSGEGECTTGGGSDVIDRAADQMKRLIRDLLDVTSMEAGLLRVEQARVPAARIVTECVEAHRPLAASAALELAVEALPDLPDVWADRDRLSQVLENLVGNALKFTEPGGRVAVGARRQASDVEFWVSDTGAGIAEHDLPHVFDRFWQARRTERRGNGLGLPIAKGIVEAHGGRIWALSRLGAGTTFYFTVPVAASVTERTAERPRPATAESPPTSGRASDLLNDVYPTGCP